MSSTSSMSSETGPLATAANTALNIATRLYWGLFLVVTALNAAWLRNTVLTWWLVGTFAVVELAAALIRGRDATLSGFIWSWRLNEAFHVLAGVLLAWSAAILLHPWWLGGVVGILLMWWLTYHLVSGKLWPTQEQGGVTDFNGLGDLKDRLVAELVADVGDSLNEPPHEPPHEPTKSDTEPQPRPRDTDLTT